MIWDWETKHHPGHDHELTQIPAGTSMPSGGLPGISWGPQMLAEDPQNQPGTPTLDGDLQQRFVSPTPAGVATLAGVPSAGQDSHCHVGIPSVGSNIWGPPNVIWAPFQWDLGTPSVTWSPQYWLGKPSTVQDPGGGCDPGGAWWPFWPCPLAEGDAGVGLSRQH